MIKRIINKLFPHDLWSKPYFTSGWENCERCSWPTLMEQYKLADETIKRWYCPNCGKIQDKSYNISSK